MDINQFDIDRALRSFEEHAKQKKIENLLRLASDTGAPPAARNWAYTQAYNLLGGKS